MIQGTELGTAQWSQLRGTAAHNSESLGKLLLEFLWSYSIGFDSRRLVVSIRNPQRVHKDDKVAVSSWAVKPFLRSVQLMTSCCDITLVAEASPLPLRVFHCSATCASHNVPL